MKHLYKTKEGEISEATSIDYDNKTEQTMEERFDELEIMSVVNGKEIFEPLQLDDHTEKVITDFIQQEIDKAIAEDRKRIVEMIEKEKENIKFLKTSKDQTIDDIINLIQNK